MGAKIERSIVGYYFYSIITLGIYSLVFWGKYSKDVNDLCEGDGKKTMKFKYVMLLSIITVGIFWFVWRYQLAKRLKENAERYDLKFREGGVAVVILAVHLDLILAKHLADALGRPAQAVGIADIV